MEVNVQLSSERFREEWERLKKAKGNISVEKILESYVKDKEFPREYISRFKSGDKKLRDDDLKIFSELFGIRKEYLAGIDDYRTEIDKKRDEQKKKDIFESFHKMLIALGYAELEMKESDYNITFPENTKLFIEALNTDTSDAGLSDLEVVRRRLKNNEIHLFLNVKENKWVLVPKNDYYLLLQEVIDFINFKLSKLFFNAEEVPSMLRPDGTIPLGLHNYLPLIGGKYMDVQLGYVPNGSLTKEAIGEKIKITMHKQIK